MEWALILVPLLYLILTPYTKVEESFNIQAAHDVLFLQTNITGYDHLDFPGVVPRTFIGPIFLATISGPFVFLANQLDVGNYFIGQYIVRAILGLCVALSLIRLKRTLQAGLGARWGWWFSLVTLSQYHLLYYSSRPLPNILTLPLVLLAVAAAFTPNKGNAFLILSGAAIIWFRAELAILLGLLLVIQIQAEKLKISEVLKTTVPAGVALVAVTLAIDSFFWQKLVWPEAEVFYFNTILNKSSQWGVSPFFWYFYSALPRGLGTSLFLIPVGLYYENRVRQLVFAAVAFIFLFSFLPHKELRFIIYTFPLLNTAAAAACHRLWENRNKSLLRWVLSLGVIGHLILNTTFTVFLLMVARVNYPGGEAIARLHQMIPADAPVYVHIGNLAAQTGVSRFTQLNPYWRYSKEENLEPGSAKMLQFTHLIIEAKSKYSTNLKPYAKTHTILESIDGFAEIAMNHQMFPPVRIKTKPLIFILERNAGIVVPELEDETIRDFVEKDTSRVETDKHINQATEETPFSNEEIDEITEIVSETTTPPGDDFLVEKLDLDILTEDPPVSDANDLRNDEHELFLDEVPVTETSVTESVVDTELESENTPESNEYDEDDLLATESKERLVESLDFQIIVKDLEERLKSKNGNIDQVLLNDDVLTYIKALTNVEYSGPHDIGKLKKALSSILNEFRDSTTENEQVDDSSGS